MTGMEWDWNYLLETLPALLRASLITLQATLLGSLLALILGLILAILRRSGFRPVKWAAWFFVEFIRSTPLLVQIYFFYYVFPSFGIKLSPLLTGVIALGLHFGSYMSEVYRAGIEGIPRGQWEASIALNLSKMRTFKDIIIPQTIPPILPVMGNYVIAMLKETPQLSAITVLELMLVAKITGSENAGYLEPFTAVGILFLIFSLTASYGIKVLERKLPKQGISLR
ncbi:MAG: ectoine/hydroxyectoine ABC transporter permease subunit EhuD [bacterium]|nr:ectoine/hydroxyectoine ABC transporter permease subunit EhuD [bacterium]